MENKNQQEIEAEKQNIKFQLSQKAREILEEPLIKEFFSIKEYECFEAFKRLPLDTTLDEYKTIHYDLLATLRLKATFTKYIQDYEMQRMVVEQGKEAEEI